jgi:hypothetical protein
MAAATLTRARSLVFRLAPEDQVELASAIVSRVSQLPTSHPRKRSVASVGRNVNHLAKAIGSPLTGKDLDVRLEKAISGKEKASSISSTNSATTWGGVGPAKEKMDPAIKLPVRRFDQNGIGLAHARRFIVGTVQALTSYC